MKTALFTLLLALFLALGPTRSPAGRARTVAATAQALVLTGTLDVAPWGSGDTLPGTVVRDGRRRATGGLGAALALVPAAALGRAVAAYDPAGRVGRVAEAATAALAVALLGVLFFAALRADGLTARAALGFTLALAFATPLVWFARVPDGTALAALLLFVAVRAARAFAAADDRRAALALGLALGALVVVTPTLLLGALVVLAWCGLHRRARLGAGVAARVLVPLSAGVALVLLHRAYTGAPPEPGGDLVQGLDGLLLSTGKSVFLYAPIVALAIPALGWLWRARRAEAELTIVVAAAVLLGAARLADWHGDPTWGPRRVMPLVPLAVEAVALTWAARPRPRRRAGVVLGILVAAGLAVQTAGVAIAPTTWLATVTEVRVASGAPSWFAEVPSECHFIPQFSPIAGHAWLLSHLVRGDRRFDANPPYALLLPDPPPRLDGLWPRLRADWPVRDWPPATALAWLGLCALAAAGAALRLRRVLR